MEFFASTISGTEPALREELSELGFKSVRLNRGGIPFRGEWEEGWRACLQSRIAQRIQVIMGRFPCEGPDELYDGVRSIDWLPFIAPHTTISVSAFTQSPAFPHSGFVALRVKDAIVDQIREDCGSRPSVSKEDPDVRIFTYINNGKATLYLDLSGDGLHRRSYRTDAGEAPMRETLAAALLRYSGWDRQTPLVDPMCGSGTIVIEAAMWARNMAPGLLRSRFGFERWANFDDGCRERLRDLCGQLRSEVIHDAPRIVGSDHDPAMILIARQNARAAGVKLAWREDDVCDMRSDGTARLIVTNPPYNVRLQTSDQNIRGIAAAFCRLHGWRVGVLAGTDEYRRAIPLPLVEDIALPNGNIPCRFQVYDIP